MEDCGGNRQPDNKWFRAFEYKYLSRVIPDLLLHGTRIKSTFFQQLLLHSQWIKFNGDY